MQVAQIQAAGNLYQQSAAAWSLRLLALFDLAAEKAEGGGAEVQGVVHRYVLQCPCYFWLSLG